MYRAEYDDKNMTLKTRPLHDWASHGADAFRTGVMGMSEEMSKSFKNSDWKKPIHRASAGTYV
jgi:hypothetical protein